MSQALPEFKDPPVVEVALAVQFEPLAAFRTPHFGLLWNKLRDRFPKIEEHAPVKPTIERFGVIGGAKPSMHFEVTHRLPVPRCWLINERGTELVQIQQDRFVRNWRKVAGDEPYPRYEKHIRPKFESDFQKFEQFLQEEKLGNLIPNQCEVTYVNHLPAGKGWEHFGDLGNVLAPFDTLYTEEFLPELEEGRVSGTYVIPGSNGEPKGRLRFSVESAYRRADDKPILVLNLVARGRPDGEGTAGVLKSFDTGREWIVRGFAALTTPEMHKIWGRKQ